MTEISIVHDPVVAIDLFTDLVDQGGLRHVTIPAVDASGVIRLRTLLLSLTPDAWRNAARRHSGRNRRASA